MKNSFHRFGYMLSHSRGHFPKFFQIRFKPQLGSYGGGEHVYAIGKNFYLLEYPKCIGPITGDDRSFMILKCFTMPIRFSSLAIERIFERFKSELIVFQSFVVLSHRR